MDYFLGIDPGCKGALVLITAGLEIIESAVMPEGDGELYSLIERLVKGRKVLAVLETPRPRPPASMTAVFSSGRGYGRLQMALCALKVPYMEVLPQTWTKSLHAGLKASKDPKAKSLLIAQQLYPGHDFRASVRCKVPHDGIIDALLLAIYGRRQYTSN